MTVKRIKIKPGKMYYDEADRYFLITNVTHSDNFAHRVRYIMMGSGNIEEGYGIIYHEGCTLKEVKIGHRFKKEKVSTD